MSLENIRANFEEARRRGLRWVSVPIEWADEVFARLDELTPVPPPEDCEHPRWKEKPVEVLLSGVAIVVHQRGRPDTAVVHGADWLLPYDQVLRCATRFLGARRRCDCGELMLRLMSPLDP